MEKQSEYTAMDCHNCGRPEDGQVCTMSKKDIDTCLSCSSRPFWKPKTSWAAKQEKKADQAVEFVRKAWEPEVNGESVKEFNKNQEGMPCDFCSHHVFGAPSYCVTCDPENSNYEPCEFEAVAVTKDTIKKAGVPGDPTPGQVREWAEKQKINETDAFIDECREEEGLQHDPWAEADRCQVCKYALQDGAEYPCIECEDGSEYVGVDDTIKKNDHDIETDYRPGSTVSNQSDRIKELVDAHWNYQEKLLSAGQNKIQMFTWDQVMEMRKWDYTSAATHFYGHGYEDAKDEQ